MGTILGIIFSDVGWCHFHMGGWKLEPPSKFCEASASCLQEENRVPSLAIWLCSVSTFARHGVRMKVPR